VEALLADDHARSLITDFYYELHYRGKDMHLFWRYSFRSRPTRPTCQWWAAPPPFLGRCGKRA
jgi:hypothetical protein